MINGKHVDPEHQEAFLDRLRYKPRSAISDAIDLMLPVDAWERFQDACYMVGVYGAGLRAIGQKAARRAFGRLLARKDRSRADS